MEIGDWVKFILRAATVQHSRNTCCITQLHQLRHIGPLVDLFFQLLTKARLWVFFAGEQPKARGFNLFFAIQLFEAIVKWTSEQER